jgi:hypothetical protein
MRGLRALAVSAGVLTALLAPAGAGVARAAGATFGTPTATATYGTSISFGVPFTASGTTTRIELRLRFPAALGPGIVDIPVPAQASTSLQYSLDPTAGSTIVPNTSISATWVAYPAGGDPVSSAPATVLYADTSHVWQTIAGSLVRVHWYQGDETFARNALRIGEKAVSDASALLGVTETGMIDFYIYGDQASFAAALGPSTRETQIGLARSDIRTLFGLITPDTLSDPVVAATVPHELVHLVFDTAVHNPYRYPPTWLNEGLAVYLSEGYSAERKSLVEQAVRNRSLMPLTALVGEFPSDATLGFLAYCEGASAVDYLVRTTGRDALARLVRAYADGLTDDEAFTRALGKNAEAFETAWLGELGAFAPIRYGPASAPPGPLPVDWGGTGTAGQQVSTSSGSDRTAVLAAIGAVVAVVLAGLLIARRRGAAG